MLKITKYIIVLLVLFISCKKKDLRKVQGGELIKIEDFQSKYVSARNVDIWLPDNYDKKDSFAVLYMHDGHSLFDSLTTWNGQEWGVDETMTKLLKQHRIRNTIVVGIWNSGANRQSDYFPQKPFESLPKKFRDSLINEVRISEHTDLYTYDINSDNYLKFIVEELKPYIDDRFSTKKDPANTFIAGSSYGGLISMYAICEYPHVFGGAACLSTHWTATFTNKNNPIPKAFANYLDQNYPDPNSHKIYFDFGTKTIDSLYEPNQALIDSVMIKNGFNEKNWITKKFEGADHSERSWMKRLEEPLVFLLEE